MIDVAILMVRDVVRQTDRPVWRGRAKMLLELTLIDLSRYREYWHQKLVRRETESHLDFGLKVSLGLAVTGPVLLVAEVPLEVRQI